MKRRSAKVLVVGGGPAGATAARVLAENGIEVLLLEKNLSFEKPCGGGLPIAAFDEFEISKQLITKEVHSIRIVSPRGAPVDIELKGGNLSIIQRKELDRALRKRAEERGAQIIEGKFLRFRKDALYTIAAEVPGSVEEFCAEYVIAADGVNSQIRTAAGLKPLQSFFTASEHIPGLNTDSCEFWFGSSHAPSSYSWVFPAAGGISAGTGTLKTGQVKACLDTFKERRGIVSEGVKRIYRIPVWKGDIYQREGILFAGDAAGQVLPFTYEGLYYAMKAGEYAARAIIEKKVDNYKKTWKARFQKRFMLMNALIHYFLKDDESAERLVALHRRPDIQDASMRLWLMKDTNRESLLSYMKLFRKVLH